MKFPCVCSFVLASALMLAAIPCLSLDMVRVECGAFDRVEAAKYPGYQPAERVQVADFLISAYEVTNELFAEFYASKGRKLNLGDSDPQAPAGSVTWPDALEFCNWLSEKEGLTPCYNGSTWNRKADGYRLPTEVEWEYAAMGGVKSRRTPYAGGSDPDQVAWYSDNARGTRHAVGRKKPNELGLYDMGGNVTEWCWGEWDGDRMRCAMGAWDGMEEDSAWFPCAVFRGGAYDSRAEQLLVTYRTASSPDLPMWADNMGFRVVRSEQPVPEYYVSFPTVDIFDHAFTQRRTKYASDADKKEAERIGGLASTEYSKTKNYRKAIALYEEALTLYPDPGWYFFLGNAHYFLKEYPESIRAFEMAVTLKHKSPQYVYYNAACSASLMDDVGGSLSFLDMAIDSGFTDFGHIGRDSDLANVRQSFDFIMLMRKHKPDYDPGPFGEEGYEVPVWQKMVDRFASSQMAGSVGIEGPQSFAVDYRGRILLLDEPGWETLTVFPQVGEQTTIRLPEGVWEDIAVGPDGTVALLDRVVRRMIVFMDTEGKVLSEVPVEGSGVPNGGNITALHFLEDGAWVEYGGRLVQIADAESREVSPRRMVEGTVFSKNGRDLIAARWEGNTGVRLTIEPLPGSGGSEKTATVSFPHQVIMQQLLDTDARGRIYVAATILKRVGSRGSIEQEVLVVLSPDGEEMKRFLLPPVNSALMDMRPMVFKTMRVDREGTVYQTGFEPNRYVIRRFENLMRWISGTQ